VIRPQCTNKEKKGSAPGVSVRDFFFSLFAELLLCLLHSLPTIDIVDIQEGGGNRYRAAD
jgi:hypothetical protein